jgi:hypothetical protein
LDPTTREGWSAGAQQFWFLPAGLAVGVAVLFALTFWDKAKSEDDSKES